MKFYLFRNFHLQNPIQYVVKIVVLLLVDQIQHSLHLEIAADHLKKYFTLKLYVEFTII
jgi:hypothetical protein